MGMIRVLIVEDDRGIRDSLTDYLTQNALCVAQSANAAEARLVLEKGGIDLVVLDIMMPGENGLSLCRHIRETLDLPVILLTARTDDTDRILGLEIGADDYVTKPFNPRELLARITTVLRRSNAMPMSYRVNKGDRVAFGPWILKLGERELVAADGVAAPLSSSEFTLLRAFVERPRRVLTREYLLEVTRGPHADIFDRSIDNQVSRLRKKIESEEGEPKYIKTVRGGGYMFCADVRRA